MFRGGGVRDHAPHAGVLLFFLGRSRRAQRGGRGGPPHAHAEGAHARARHQRDRAKRFRVCSSGCLVIMNILGAVEGASSSRVGGDSMVFEKTRFLVVVSGPRMVWCCVLVFVCARLCARREARAPGRGGVCCGVVAAALPLSVQACLPFLSLVPPSFSLSLLPFTHLPSPCLQGGQGGVATHARTRGGSVAAAAACGRACACIYDYTHTHTPHRHTTTQTSPPAGARVGPPPPPSC